MGLFSFLFGNTKPTNIEVVPDHIWMTTDAKFNGLTKEAETRSRTETVAILLVAHFPDVLARLEQIVGQQTWGVACKAVLASNLNKDLAAILNLNETAVIDIIVGERHPLPSMDERLKEFADELPCRCRFSHHVSLEDAMMKTFAADWVKGILERLGMKEDEAIESEMISRRIRGAQKKIEGRSPGNLEAFSAAQWLEENCPELVTK